MARRRKPVIARLWHGAVPAKKANAYYEYLKETGLAEYGGTPGNEGVYVLRQVEDQTAHFLLVSFWESFEAIRAFAGDDVERARYYPEDANYLLEMEPKVQHYEVLEPER
jgi:heme-degrading monooxygenase HmoA